MLSPNNSLSKINIKTRLASRHWSSKGRFHDVPLENATKLSLPWTLSWQQNSSSSLITTRIQHPTWSWLPVLGGPEPRNGLRTFSPVPRPQGTSGPAQAHLGPSHSSYTSQGLGQAEQIHSHLPSTLFLLALWWELRRWRERWASQWRWLITTQVRGLFVLLSFSNVISTGGNWERTERQNVIWANNKWLIYKKLTNNNNNKQTKKISWSCQNGTVKKNCKLNICGLFLRVVTVEGNKHSLVNTKNKFTKFSCHVFNIV